MRIKQHIKKTVVKLCLYNDYIAVNVKINYGQWEIGPFSIAIVKSPEGNGYIVVIRRTMQLMIESLMVYTNLIM